MDWLDKVVIRHLKKEDLPSLEWEGEYAHFRRVYASSYKRHQSGLSLMWVCELPVENIIGQIFVQFECDRIELADGMNRAYFYSFRIRPEYRGSGLGAKMLSVIEDDLQSRDFCWITCNVAKDNLRAIKFYQRHGYQIVAHETGKWAYPDQHGEWIHVHEPAWRMEKEITRGDRSS